MTTAAALPPIPTAAGSLPLIGHTVPLLRDALTFTSQLRDYGDLVRIRLGSQSMIVVNSPSLLREVLVDLAPKMDKGRFFEKMALILGDSVVSAAGAEHVAKRRRLQPAFHRAAIAGYVDQMREQVSQTIGDWAPGETVDVLTAMTKLALDMLAATVFSGSLDTAQFEELRRHLPVVMTGVGTRIMAPDWLDKLPTPGNRRFNASRARVREIIGDAVDGLRASGHDSGDMLSMLLQARDDVTGEPMTRHQICSEVLTLAVAGTETTASVLSWVLYELSQHPDVEKRLREELDHVLEGRPVGFDDIPKLPYLRNVINETLRMHHTGWLVTRRTAAPIRLGGRDLPAGTNLAYCQHALHRDPSFFPEPERFAPDRWQNEDWVRSLGDAWIPFAAGKHKCLGDHFAWTELTTTIATIAAAWRLELAPGQQVRAVARATVRPNGLLMTATPGAVSAEEAA